MGLLEIAKKIIRISFYLLQIAIIITGIMSLFFTFLLYLRFRSSMAIPSYLLMNVFVFALLAILNSYLGFSCLNSEKKSKIFLFILTLTIMMNFQMIFLIKSSNFIQNRETWMNLRWNHFSNAQKNVLQLGFKCCGFETINDRSTKQCRFTTPCSVIFNSISKTVIGYVQTALYSMFLIESLSLSFLSYIKFIK